MKALTRFLGRWWRWLWPIFALFGSFFILHREFHDFRYGDIVAVMQALSPVHLVAAVLLTAACYAVLTAYDALALAYVRHPVAVRRIAFGSFIAYALSQTLGFPLLTGGSVRYRFWSAWGLSTTEIAAALGFAAMTFSIGLIVISGMALAFEPASTAALLGLPAQLLRPLAALCFGVILLYLVWCATGPHHIRLHAWSFPIPTLNIAVLQLMIAVADWSLAGSVLYILLGSEHDLAFPAFMAIFLLAQLAGLFSHVPGGLGVFEALMVLLLRPYLPATSVLSALIAYRAIYYLLPFLIGVCLLVGYEIRRRRAHFGAFARRTGQIAGVAANRWLPSVLPYALGLVTFAAGALLLVSGATPSVYSRMQWLERMLPAGVVAISHFINNVVGTVLMILGWGLSRRLDAAYGLTVTLLGIGIAASLLKGLDWEEALFLSLVLLTLLPSHHAFYRRAALTSEPLTPGWIIALVGVVLAVGLIGVFSFRDVEARVGLWWHFTTHRNAASFLHATTGSLATLLALGLLYLFRYAPARPELPSRQELDRARQIIATSPNSTAHLALVGDKALLFSETGNGFLMYAVEGRSWVAMGDPIGPAREQVELAWRFREEADHAGGWTVFYEVSSRHLPLYVDLGLTLLKLGEEARVPLASFSIEGRRRQDLRRARRDAERQGLTFSVQPAERVPALLPQLRHVSDTWLAAKSTREKGFSLGYFDDAYLSACPVAVAQRGAEIIAFANLWLGADLEELSIDLMRYTSDAPGGVMDYLLVELMLWGKAQGYQWFNLGMAPLSGLENRTLAPLWNRLGALIFRHGENFYNFRGLRQYKEKFDPVWEPKYIASPGGLVLPRVLTNVATLISGGFKGLVTK